MGFGWSDIKDLGSDMADFYSTDYTDGEYPWTDYEEAWTSAKDDPIGTAKTVMLAYSGDVKGAYDSREEQERKEEERKKREEQEREQEELERQAAMESEGSYGDSGGGTDWTGWIEDIWDSLFGDSGGSSDEGGTKTSKGNSSDDGFDWGSIIGPLLTAGAGGIGNYLEGQISAEEAKKALEAKRQTDLLNLQLEALKAAKERPMNPTPVWAPGKLGLDDRVNAKQSAANSKTSQLNALISAYQNGMR